MAKQEQFNSFKYNWFVLTDILLVNGNEQSLLLPKFARPLYFFLLISFLASLETQGRLVGARGNKSGKEMKRRMFTSKHTMLYFFARFISSRPN